MATQQSPAKGTEGLDADADPAAQRLPLISAHRKREKNKTKTDTRTHMAPFFGVSEDFVSRIACPPLSFGNQVNLILPFAINKHLSCFLTTRRCARCLFVATPRIIFSNSDFSVWLHNSSHQGSSSGRDRSRIS